MRAAVAVSRSRAASAPVLVNGSPLWPPVTGVQRVARGLADRLLIEAEPGEVEVIGGPPEFGGAGALVPGGRAGRALWEQTGLALRARGAEALMNLGNLGPVASDRNLVLTYDLHALRLPAHYRRGWASLYWRLSAAAYRRARYRITLSRTIADELEATLGGHVDRVLPPGIDAAFRPTPPERVAAARSRWGIEGPYLIVVGWAQPAKRVGVAMEAHRRLRGDLPHSLVVVGQARPDFARVALGSPRESVILAGRPSDGDLAALYTGAAGLLFPSEYEGFGLPPVEALACGAPVAASEIPVLREVLGGLQGVRFVEDARPQAWAEAAAWLLSVPPDDRAVRSAAAHGAYPWEGKGRALLEIIGR